MFDWKKPTIQLLGRWQPWHDGHTELFKKAYRKTRQVCIMIRDVSGIDDNPFDIESVKSNIVSRLHEQGFKNNYDYVVVEVPNIVDISYGRGVGYTFTEHNLGEKIHNISATNIRSELRESGKLKQKEIMREKIRMQSTESAHFYTRHKNKRLHPEKMALNMYDPYIRKHCKYTEQKIKK